MITGKSYRQNSKISQGAHSRSRARRVESNKRRAKEKQGENWRGNGGYAGADAFAKHFAHICRDLNSYNEVRAFIK